MGKRRRVRAVVRFGGKSTEIPSRRDERLASEALYPRPRGVQASSVKTAKTKE